MSASATHGGHNKSKMVVAPPVECNENTSPAGAGFRPGREGTDFSLVGRTDI